jgi:hypothetical protein
MGLRDLLFVGLVVGGSALVAANLYPRRVVDRATISRIDLSASQSLAATTQKVNDYYKAQWHEAGIEPAKRVDELAVIRRLSLGLTATIPSLEELRSIENVPPGSKVDRWVDLLLGDRRYADTLAERFARAYVGIEGGPFIVFRRRKFVTWLSDRLYANVPYNQIVRELIVTDGLWTDHPATNFLTVTYDPEKKQVDPERLAGRVARAFLGVRIDCAQCHDHPFESWKQQDFQGLAAFFGQAQSGFIGMHEEAGEYQFMNRKTGKPQPVEPRVPFLGELLPSEGNRRVRLAQWLTDPANPSLAKATVNRVWALMFGRPLVEPVDDLGSVEDRPQALDILADDFINHDFDLKRLIRVISSLEVFRLDSALDIDAAESHEHEWAVFPITRLRPDQVVGSLLQAASLTTIDAESPILIRIMRSIGHAQFVGRYGDSGEDEFDAKPGTIPQRLLMMNGELINDRTKSGLFNSATRIGSFAASDRAAVELIYQIVLTRKPTSAELAHFEKKLAGSKGKDREERMSDILWTLLNATEFSWNH